MPSHLGAFILSNTKRKTIIFVGEVNGFCNYNIYYGYTDSMYIEKKYGDVLDKAKFVGKKLCQCKNDFKTGGMFYGLFLAPKIKFCSTIKEFGIIEEHKTFKGFNDKNGF